jgi:hypothetical protein
LKNGGLVAVQQVIPRLFAYHSIGGNGDAFLVLQDGLKGYGAKDSINRKCGRGRQADVQEPLEFLNLRTSYSLVQRLYGRCGRFSARCYSRDRLL